MLFRPINRTDIKRNDVVLVRTKRMIIFFPLKKSKRRRFITHFNQMLTDLTDLTDRLLTVLPT
jgi:hypothetical protein